MFVQGKIITSKGIIKCVMVGDGPGGEEQGCRPNWVEITPNFSKPSHFIKIMFFK